MKLILLFGVFVYLIVFVLADGTTSDHETAKNSTEIKNETVMEISGDTLKKIMWRKCSNSSYITCAKLALVYVVEKLDSSESYTLLPGVSLKQYDNAVISNLDEILVKRDFNEALDEYLLAKIRQYLGSLTLSVKLLDKNTIDNVRSFGDSLIDSSEKEIGRGKKKYMQSLLMAGWMSGATLLALTMKTIAILSGKALLAALLSLMLSVISAFSGKGHSGHQSTTYEIITKPIVAHSHAAEIHEAHPSEINPTYATYKRSISPDIILRGPNIPVDIEHIIRKIEDRTPYFNPMEYSKS